jgi:hypothetical protein
MPQYAELEGELDAFAESNLPVPAAVEYPLIEATFPVPPPPQLGYAPEAPLPIGAGAEAIKKQGSWTVPPYLALRAGLGSILLDFQVAHPVSQVIYVDIIGDIGSITMVVPQGWAAQMVALRPGLGSRRSSVLEEPVSGYPLLYLSGSMSLGSLTVRYPKASDLRSLKRLQAKGQQILR